MRSGPLHGLRVADFSRVLAGPYCSMMLSDLGADVIKVERPDTGDETRGWGPPFVEGTSTYFSAVNRNKRSVALDLSTARDQQLASRLIERSDVVVENFRAGVMDRFGLGYEAQRATNPGLVYCSITGFGSEVEGRYAGYDFIVQAMGGLMSVTGDADGEPTKVGVAVVDVMTGMNAVIAILAALKHREHDGLGQHVEVSLMSTALAAMVNQVSAYLGTGEPPGRAGNAHPSISPYETFETRDGTIAIAAGNDAQFRRLCEVLGIPEYGVDGRFATNQRRVECREELRVVLGQAFARRPLEEWMADLREHNVPCGAVQDIAAAVEFAQELGLEPVIRIGGDDAAIPQVANPITFGKGPISYRSAPPALDADGDEIRSWLAGARDDRGGPLQAEAAGPVPRPEAAVEGPIA